MGAIVDMIYPKAKNCIAGHRGKKKLIWHWESDDDRSYLMVVEICSHCQMPCGLSDYATPEQIRAYNRGDQPERSKEVVSK
jgi:hypothetical protein